MQEEETATLLSLRCAAIVLSSKGVAPFTSVYGPLLSVTPACVVTTAYPSTALLGTPKLTMSSIRTTCLPRLRTIGLSRAMGIRARGLVPGVGSKAVAQVPIPLLVDSGLQLQRRLMSQSQHIVEPDSDLVHDDASPLRDDMEDFNKTSLLMEVDDKPGALHEILRWFWKNDVNVTRIESRPSKRAHTAFDIFVDVDGARGEDKIDTLLQQLKRQINSLLVLDNKEVPWFPRYANQLDIIANRVLDAGTDLEADHPGFSDKVYRERRGQLAEVARRYRHGQPIPRIKYTEDEVVTWGAVFERQEALLHKFACKEYLDILPLMKKYCGFSKGNIPQQEDISLFLQRRTGFKLRPVAGLLSSRDFLNGLAFRVFFSTQYIRHHSKPLYTPEPDICHELLGHAPMFADPDFADFSQEIGLASLGASDDDVQKLATCYWHSVEFGLCRQKGEVKAYGAGLLSSFGELEYACAPYRPAGGTDEKPKLLPWDPNVAQSQAFPITTYQPVYFVAESLMDAKERMRKYCENLKRPFYARYYPMTQSIWVDRAVRVGPKSDTDPE